MMFLPVSNTYSSPTDVFGAPRTYQAVPGAVNIAQENVTTPLEFAYPISGEQNYRLVDL